MTSMKEQNLDSFIGSAFPTQQLDLDRLRDLWTGIVGSSPSYQGSAFDQVVDSFASCDGLTLDFGAGAWTIDLKAATVGGILQAALLAGILWANGLDGVPAAVASAVIPAVVSLESVRLTPGEEIRFQVVKQALSKDKSRSVASIYRRLPAKARGQVSVADLADFLDRLRSAGVVDRRDGGYVDRDRPAWMRITLK